MWTRAGAWTASESLGSVAPCSPPDASSRCLGWNTTIGATQCGSGYLQGSYLCGSCDQAFYGDSDGACKPCPVLKSPWQLYSGIVYIVVAIVALVVTVWAGLVLMVCLRGGTLAGGAKTMIAFAIWALQAAQVVSNAGTVTAASLPPLIRRLYASVAALQLEGVLLPPACTGAYPFEQEASLMALALCCWGGAIAAYYCSPRCARGCRIPALARTLRSAGRVALVAALVLYSAVSHVAVQLLVCDSVSMSPAGVLRLNGGGSLATAAPSASVRVSTLSSNPFFVCWTRNGAHLPVGILAAVTLVAYVFALPVLTLIWACADSSVGRSRACLSRHRRCLRLGNLLESGGLKGGSAVLHSTVQSGPQDSAVSDVVTMHNPLRQVHPQMGSSDPSSSASGDGFTAPYSSGPHPLDPLVAPLVSDFAPDAYYTKWVDLGLLLLLSLLRALMPRPSTTIAVATKSSIACGGILAVALHVAVVRPYPRHDSWKGWMRFLLLLDAAGCVAMNAAVTLQDYRLSTTALDATVRGGAFALFAACVLTLAVLVVGVTASTYMGVAEEADSKTASAASLAAACPAVGVRPRHERAAPASVALVFPDGDEFFVNGRLAHGPVVDAARTRDRPTAPGTQDNDQLMHAATAPRGVRRAAYSSSARRSARASASSSSSSRRVAEHVSVLEQLQSDFESAAEGGDRTAAAAAESHLVDTVERVRVALRSRKVCSRAAAASVCPLVAVLKKFPPHSAVWAAACDALSAAAATDDVHHGSTAAVVSAALVDAGAVPALVDVLTCSTSISVERCVELEAANVTAKRAASAALARLAHTPLGAASVVASGCVGPLCTLLALSDTTLESIAAACAPLAALAMHHDDPAHVAALTSAGTMEAVAGALSRLAAFAGPPLQLAGMAHSNDAEAPAVYPRDPSARAAVEAAAAVVTNATINEGALARFVAAGGLAPLLALLAGASASGDAALVSSLAAALCSVAVSTQGAAALCAAGLGAERVMLEALAAEAASPDPSPDILEPLCWSLSGVAGALQRAAAVDAVAGERVVALAGRGVPLMRRMLASPAGHADHVAARARALLHSLEGGE